MTTPDEAQALLPVTPEDDLEAARRICAQCAGDAGTINRPIAPRFLAGELDSHPSMIAALTAIAHTRESYRHQSLPLPGDGMLKLEWRDGPPPKPWSEEWFIAETIYGDRVTLRSLPEEWSYDFTTADETYMKAENVKRWMQFPDSQYRAPAQATELPQ